MRSLASAYAAGADASVRRRYLGGGLLLSGIVLAILGTLIGATGSLSGFGYGLYESRRIAAVLGGVGVPVALFGTIVLVPAEGRAGLLSAFGVGLVALAICWFWVVYPAHWAGYGLDRTLPVSALYLAGLTLTVLALFVGVAGIETRREPGGSVSLSIVRRDESRPTGEPSADVAPDSTGSAGSVAILGVLERTRGDGGTTAGSAGTDRPTGGVDAYCGNCRHVEYTTDDGRLRPYCRYHGTGLESMDACPAWDDRVSRGRS